MKYILFLTFFLPFISMGQPVIKVKDQKEKSTYYVLSNNKEIRHGAYELKNSQNQLSLVGNYKNGKKDSVWTVYNHKKEPIQKYDFATDSLILKRFFDNPPSNTYTYYPNTGRALSKGHREAIYLPGLEYLRYEISRRFFGNWSISGDFPDMDILARVVIDETGKAQDVTLVKAYGYGVDRAMVKTIQSLPALWIPARENGKNVAVEITIPMKIYQPNRTR